VLDRKVRPDSGLAAAANLGRSTSAIKVHLPEDLSFSANRRAKPEERVKLQRPTGF
jgi:hypothetical protein